MLSGVLPGICSAGVVTLQKKNLLEQFKERLEPSVAGPTVVNDGSIFMALGIWYALLLVLQMLGQLTFSLISLVSACSPFVYG